MLDLSSGCGGCQSAAPCVLRPAVQQRLRRTHKQAQPAQSKPADHLLLLLHFSNRYPSVFIKQPASA